LPNAIIAKKNKAFILHKFVIFELKFRVLKC